MSKAAFTLVLTAVALSTVAGGPTAAQTVRPTEAAPQAVPRRDVQPTNYWFSRDLSNVLTKVVTIKVR